MTGSGVDIHVAVAELVNGLSYIAHKGLVPVNRITVPSKHYFTSASVPLSLLQCLENSTNLIESFRILVSYVDREIKEIRNNCVYTWMNNDLTCCIYQILIT